jgi:hypothetical protein
MTKGEYRLELLKQRIEIWKTIVDTQQHFNTLQVQLRNFSLTLLTAVFTVIGFAIKEHLRTLAECVSVAGLVVLAAFYCMDWGYHQLLKGSVRAGTDIEPRLRTQFNGPGLSARILEGSRAKKFLGLFLLDSTRRLNVFYFTQFIVLAAVAILVSFVIPSDNSSQQSGAGAPSNSKPPAANSGPSPGETPSALPSAATSGSDVGVIRTSGTK